MPCSKTRPLVLFTTDEEARLAGQTFALEAMRSSVVGYGIAPPAHLSETQRQTFFAQWPSCQDKRLILFLSRIHPKKGADLLLEAFACKPSAIRSCTW